MKKKKILIGVLIAILVLAGAVALFVKARLPLHNAVQKNLNFCVPAKMVTDFSERMENAEIYENQYYTVDLEPGYVKVKEVDTGTSATSYEWEEGRGVIYFNEPGDLTSSLEDMEGMMEYGITSKGLRKGLKDLGFEDMDSYYTIMKAALMCDKEDYSFLDKNNQSAFYVLGMLREEVYYDSACEIYERDNIRAIISPVGKRIIMNIFNEDDLNTVYTIYIADRSMEDAYKILNSFEFK